MIPVSYTSSPSASIALKPYHLHSLIPVQTRYNQLKKLKQKKLRGGKCRAEFSSDAPLALAIGACFLNSFIFPSTPPAEDGRDGSFISSDDARFAVMGVISFIPYFNWMSWVFAWLDTGKRRYAVYAIVYLAPYLRPNLSISPEESWLPIMSILICIAHIQLEASMSNGDTQGFQVFNNVAKLVSSMSKQSKNLEERKRRNDSFNLPPAREHYRNKMLDWAAPDDHEEDHDILNEDEDTH